MFLFAFTLLFIACIYPVYPSLDPYNQSVGIRRYQIRKDIFSIRDTFEIEDEVGQNVFTVRSNYFTIGKKLALEDMAENNLVEIHGELWTFHRTYKILSARKGDSDRELGVVKQKCSFFHYKFHVDSVYGEYSMVGLDYAARSFELTKQGSLIATIKKAFFSLTDTYTADIAANEDQAFVLALVIVIDQVLADDKDSE